VACVAKPLVLQARGAANAAPKPTLPTSRTPYPNNNSFGGSFALQ